MSEISIPTFPGPPKMKHTQNINNFETKSLSKLGQNKQFEHVQKYQI